MLEGFALICFYGSANTVHHKGNTRAKTRRPESDATPIHMRTCKTSYPNTRERSGLRAYASSVCYRQENIYKTNKEINKYIYIYIL